MYLQHVFDIKKRFDCQSVCGQSCFLVKQPEEDAEDDTGVFMEMHELVSDVNVVCVSSVTELAP